MNIGIKKINNNFIENGFSLITFDETKTDCQEGTLLVKIKDTGKVVLKARKNNTWEDLGCFVYTTKPHIPEIGDLWLNINE